MDANSLLSRRLSRDGSTGRIAGVVLGKGDKKRICDVSMSLDEHQISGFHGADIGEVGPGQRQPEAGQICLVACDVTGGVGLNLT